MSKTPVFTAKYLPLVSIAFFNFAASFWALKFGSGFTVPKYAVSAGPPLKPCDETWNTHWMSNHGLITNIVMLRCTSIYSDNFSYIFYTYLAAVIITNFVDKLLEECHPLKLLKKLWQVTNKQTHTYINAMLCLWNVITNILYVCKSLILSQMFSKSFFKICYWWQQ